MIVNRIFSLHYYTNFQDGYKKFRKTDILSMASPGQDIPPPQSAVLCYKLLHSAAFNVLQFHIQQDKQDKQVVSPKWNPC